MGVAIITSLEKEK